MDAALSHSQRSDVDRCWVCAFSFFEHSKAKLDITDEISSNIKKAMQTDCSIPDLDMAICVKCYRKVDKCLSMERQLRSLRKELEKSHSKLIEECTHPSIGENQIDRALTTKNHSTVTVAVNNSGQINSSIGSPTNVDPSNSADKTVTNSTLPARKETGLSFTPISYLQSPFTFKNGTPRQAMVCSEARGIIHIEKSVFTNPEHSLEGLENFSHIWIIFIFHKNNCQYTKAKVKPPRLNGERVGLYSTRCPYRPNNIGLSLAKIERVEGASITVSGIDILDGTPIIDIKPYIEQYDNPGSFPVGLQGTSLSYTHTYEVAHTEEKINENISEPETERNDSQNIATDNFEGVSTGAVKAKPDTMETVENSSNSDFVQQLVIARTSHEEKPIGELHSFSSGNMTHLVQNESDIVSDGTGLAVTSELTAGLDTNLGKTLNDDNKDNFEIGTINVNTSSVDDNEMDSKRRDVPSAAEWITRPPVSTLQVCFTLRALDQLKNFTSTAVDVRYRLKFMKTWEEARQAVVNILHEDPRSVYRRTKCADSLYYFTVDVLHVTCWFDNAVEDGSVEVVRVKPAADVEQCKHKFAT